MKKVNLQKKWPDYDTDPYYVISVSIVGNQLL